MLCRVRHKDIIRLLRMTAPGYFILRNILFVDNNTDQRRCISVGIVTGYGLDDRGSIPDRGWEFFSSPPRPDRL
jgi:hypothetical protein